MTFEAEATFLLFFITAFVHLSKKDGGGQLHPVCVFPPLSLSLKSVLIIIAGCPSALPQNVAMYRGPNRVKYTETGRIEINVEPPDSGGQIFLMVFSILTS